MISSTVEDYLKQLYLSGQEPDGGETVSTGRLADAMGVTPGSVTAMLKALSGSGLVEYEARRGARLTAQGQHLALHVLRRHRLLELFLVRTLGLDWSVVHDEAELLEHVVSDRVLDAIDRLLDYPSSDPHGDPIPGGSTHVEQVETTSLATCAVGKPQTITRLLNQKFEFLRHASRCGLVPNATVTVVSRETSTDALVVRADAMEPVSLSIREGAKVMVRPR